MSRETATILCEDCAAAWAVRESVGGASIQVYLAALGPVPEDDDVSILVCVPWDERGVPSLRRPCADCGAEVAVAPSSLWLLGESRPGPS